jgi:hypothetical protein
MSAIPTTRRAILGAALLYPTTGLCVPSMVVEDPIHAAIERCRTAYETVEAACARQAAMEADPQFSWGDVEDATAPAWAELSEARAQLFDTMPTTVDGCIAALRYVSRPEFCDQGFDLPPPAFLQRIADGLERQS